MTEFGISIRFKNQNRNIYKTLNTDNIIKVLDFIKENYTENLNDCDSIEIYIPDGIRIN